MEPEQESSRSATKADMLQIIDALETRGVDYILIGGHARAPSSSPDIVAEVFATDFNGGLKGL